MEWTADVSSGDWLTPRIDDPATGSVHDVVPRGFPSHIRVFHPAVRERPADAPWPPLPFARHRRQWEEFTRAGHDIVAEPVAWAQAARAFGTVMHPLAQWELLVAPGTAPDHDDFPRDGDGWRYLDPAEGRLEASTLAALAGVLARHTTTPDAGGIALWDGWGAVTGGMGYAPSRVVFGPGDGMPDPADPDGSDIRRHAAVLSEVVRDFFNNPYPKPAWQAGTLSDEISKGPRLHLPTRDFVLFRGGVAELADPGWAERVPWRDAAAGADATVESPGIVWPDDHAWAMVSDVDLDSTLVGGSPALIRDIAACPGLEALPVPAGAALDPV